MQPDPRSWTRSGSIERICLTCDHVFHLSPSHLTSAHKGDFCSRACWSEWKRCDAYFWSRVHVDTGNDACWPWTEAVNRKGYGVLTIDYKLWLAHRRAYVLSGGTIPPGSYVLHRCDNPLCCRPKHLFLGTLADNNADMVAKGRNDQWGHKKRRAPKADNS